MVRWFDGSMVCIGVYGDVLEYMVLIRGSTIIIGMFRYIIIIIYEVRTTAAPVFLLAPLPTGTVWLQEQPAILFCSHVRSVQKS